MISYHTYCLGSDPQHSSSYPSHAHPNTLPLQVAARAGGIFFPLAKALCLACGSSPENGTEKKVGAYVMLTCFQTSTISSAMFITAMAANPLAVNLAADALGSQISWVTPPSLGPHL